LPGWRSVRFPGYAVLMVRNLAGDYGLAEAEELLLAVQQVPAGPVRGSDSLTRLAPCWAGTLHLYFNLRFLPHGRGLRPIFARQKWGVSRPSSQPLLHASAYVCFVIDIVVPAAATFLGQTTSALATASCGRPTSAISCYADPGVLPPNCGSGA